MKKKVLAGILAATMVFSLAACGSTGSDSDSGSSAASGSTAKTEEEGEPYTVTMVLQGTTQPDEERIEEKINEILEPELNAKLDIVVLPWASASQQLKLMLSGDEKIDLLYTSASTAVQYMQSGQIMDMSELIDKYDNLIVVQTFSKARSMAGMRIGYAISNPTLIKYLNDAKYSFNSYTMNQTSIVCGVEAVKDREYFENGVRKIVETREWAKEELTKLGFTYLDSGSNFIFAKHPEYDAKELFEALKAHDIYVRFWGSERIEQYMRITIGTREEMEQLFAFLRICVAGVFVGKHYFFPPLS